MNWRNPSCYLHKGIPLSHEKTLNNDMYNNGKFQTKKEIRQEKSNSLDSRKCRLIYSDGKQIAGCFGKRRNTEDSRKLGWICLLSRLWCWIMEVRPYKIVYPRNLLCISCQVYIVNAVGKKSIKGKLNPKRLH